MRHASILLCALLAACASAPDATVPNWDSIPPSVADAVCTRLQMDAIGTGGGLTIVRETQPFVTPAAIAALGANARRPPTWEHVSAAIREGNRKFPLSLAQSRCGWVPIDSARRAALTDEMIVEVSAPLINPFFRTEAGLFARAILGSQEEWYWVALGRRGDQWGVRQVTVVLH